MKKTAKRVAILALLVGGGFYAAVTGQAVLIAGAAAAGYALARLTG